MTRTPDQPGSRDGPPNLHGGILVTGARGNVGSEVCRALATSGLPVFGASRAEAPKPDGSCAVHSSDRLHGAKPVVLDFTDPATWDAALTGVRKVFLVRPPHISNIRRDMTPFLRFLKRREVDHVVFLSVQGAERSGLTPHAKIERAIAELGLPHTFIRPSFFMQNLTTTHLPEIRDEHRIYVPAGDGLTNFIDVRDIGDAAACILTRHDASGTAHTITGDASYTYREVADELSRVLDTRVVYQNASMIPFLRYQRRQGRRLGHALVMYLLYSVTRIGRAGSDTDTFADLVGRAPRSLADFVSDHRELFLAGSA